MIVTAIAYDMEKNLGRAYNEIASRLRPEDWVCFLDHDAMFTTDGWYRQLQVVIQRYPDGGLFTAMTNRIGLKWQVHDPVLSEQRLSEVGGPVWTVKGNTHDMRVHRSIGQDLATRHGTDCVDLSRSISNGVVMLTSRAVWERIGFRDGFGAVDTSYHRAVAAAGHKVYLMRGVYVYHWYRQSS